MGDYDLSYMYHQRPADSTDLLHRFWKDIQKYGLPKLIGQQNLNFRHFNVEEMDEKWKRESLAELCLLLLDRAVGFQVGIFGSIWQIVPLAGQKCSVGLLPIAQSKKFRPTGRPWLITIEPIEDEGGFGVLVHPERGQLAIAEGSSGTWSTGPHAGPHSGSHAGPHEMWITAFDGEM